MGTSFLTSSDRNLTFKAGLSWQFGSPKKQKLASSDYQTINTHIAQTDWHHKEQKQNAKIRELKAELNLLKKEKNQEVLALKVQLKRINTMLSRSGFSMVKKM